MTSPSQTPLPHTPAHVFGRAATIVLIAALGLTAIVQLTSQQLFQRTARLSESAMLATIQSLAAREIVTELESLAQLEPGFKRHRAAFNTIWRLDQIERFEAKRAALGIDARGSAERQTAIASAAAEIGAERDRITSEAARRLAATFADEFAPEYERSARRLEIEARAARERLGVWQWWLLAANVLCYLGLAFGIIRPAAARTRAWVNAADAAARDANFRLLHDSKTEMPNATYLKTHLRQLAASAEGNGGETAVLRISLDRFARLRETLGERSAEEILQIATWRIRRCLRTADFAACLGQNDFVVVTVELDDVQGASAVAQRLQAALCKPFALGDSVQRLTATIGITLMSDDVADPDRILGNAEIAQREARALGSGQVQYFCGSMRHQVEARETFYRELSGGIVRGEIVPFFQPQVDLATGEFCGFEALARWRHPQRGILGPGAFLEFADQTELTERIGDAILTQTLAAIRGWDDAGLAVPRVGVNFSVGQLRDPGLIERIKWEVERFNLTPGRLAIEVLETVLIESDADPVVRNLRGLASAGFHIELDDFGTGHAAISNLRRFMVDRVKIDMSFVLGIEASAEQQKLTASMVALARTLGISTLAEGVETEEAEAILRELGCDCAQGYLFAKPMSFDDAVVWLRRFEPRLAAAAEPKRRAAAR